jgi:hypothetical protein
MIAFAIFAKADTAKFVEVAFVIVPFVAVKLSTDKIFAHKVAKTFKLVIDEVEIVVVPKVAVAPVKLPATFTLPVAAIVFAEIFPVTVALVIVALVFCKLLATTLVPVILVETIFVEVLLVTVAFVTTALVAVKSVTVPVAIVVVASAVVPVAVILLATNEPVVVALVPVAFVQAKLVVLRVTTFNIFAHKVLSTFNQVIDEVETVVVPKVVVAADKVCNAVVPVAVILPVASEVVVAFPVVAFPFTKSELVINCPAAVSFACWPT